MAVELYSTATEYLANALTFNRGDSSDVVSVHVYHDADPNAVPAELDFITVALIEPPDPLAEGSNIDVMSLIGPGPGAHELLAGGVGGNAVDYQRWVAIKTASEFIIRKTDTVSVI